MTNPSPETPVVIPQEIVNDEFVKLVCLLTRPGERVEAGAAIAEIETSKAVIEVSAPCDGYFHTQLEPGAKVAVGGELGVMTETAVYDGRMASGSTPDVTSAASQGASVVTVPAQRLIEAHGLDQSLFSQLPLVRRADVEAYITTTGGPTKTESFRDASAVHAPAPSGSEPVDALIIGAGGHGAVIVDILHRTPGVRLIGIAEANPALIGRTVVGDYQVVALQDEVSERYDPERVALFIAIGDNRTRLDVADAFAKRGFGFVNAIDPTATVALGVRLGVGVAVMPQAVIGARSSVGDHGIVNTKTSIDHDCTIGRAAHIGPGTTLGGQVFVGDRALIGIGCSVNKNVRIGDEATIASGFTLYRDVSGGTVLTTKIGRIWW